MIQIKDKRFCCGCAACVQICPKQCISLSEDSKGFSYPIVDKNVCINCGLCEAVCPFINQNGAKKPLNVVAAINPDENIRMKSSSGGIFTMLAEKTINEGGVVFGASFAQNWEVHHKFTETIDGLSAFRGAKYVQSIIGESFRRVKSFLLQGRKVLFSGTGCQIAGLRLFLRKEYDNLSTIEIACHGVPSRTVWRSYLAKVANGNPDMIHSINFRDKRNGWNAYGLSISTDKGIIYERASDNQFMQSFLRDLCLRPSCFNCPVKHGSSGADIIIGDFWGVESIRPEIFDNKGCSLIVVNSLKGRELIDQIDVKTVEITYEESYRYNPCLIKSSVESRYSPIFWNKFKKYGIDACGRTLGLIERNKYVRILALVYSKLLLKHG